ncbi:MULTISPECIES: hypothetical protein [Chryseobacterium]|uniref:hypothetical protein n=1 Tax=Chryseobacterium TaxID=59732 RepID=UPI001625141A|nr:MULTISPECIES: hypothetical protein [Chryseobacterium]MDR6920855.1 hypothetical protein [Chryseobacterium sp. 2987]
MKKLLSLFLMLQAMWLSAQQECSLKYVYHTDSLQNQGIVRLSVTNIGSKKLRSIKAFLLTECSLWTFTRKVPIPVLP